MERDSRIPGTDMSDNLIYVNPRAMGSHLSKRFVLWVFRLQASSLFMVRLEFDSLSHSS